MDEDLAGFARTYRDFVERMTQLAHAEARSPVRDRLDAHLGVDTTDVPILAGSFDPWDHINVQVAITPWLAEPGRSHETIGLMGRQRHHGSMSDLMALGRFAVVRTGSVGLVGLPMGREQTRGRVNL